jgi:hypothetical protein
MMQCGLELLLVAAGGQASCAMLPALLKMLRSIQRTRDGDEAAGCEPQLWAMADLGLVVARALARRELRGKAPAGEEYPGEVALPSSLYRMPREGAVGGWQPVCAVCCMCWPGWCGCWWARGCTTDVLV